MACTKCTVMDVDGSCPHELKSARVPSRKELQEENARLKARVKMLRKLRDVRVIMVWEPNGNLCFIGTVPTFAYEKKVDYITKLRTEMKDRFNQDLIVEVPLICDTMIEVDAELHQLNDIAEESDG